VAGERPGSATSDLADGSYHTGLAASRRARDRGKGGDSRAGQARGVRNCSAGTRKIGHDGLHFESEGIGGADHHTLLPVPRTKKCARRRGRLRARPLTEPATVTPLKSPSRGAVVKNLAAVSPGFGTCTLVRQVAEVALSGSRTASPDLELAGRNVGVP